LFEMRPGAFVVRLGDRCPTKVVVTPTDSVENAEPLPAGERGFQSPPPLGNVAKRQLELSPGLIHHRQAVCVTDPGREFSRLVEELRILKEDLREEEFEGVANPIVTANIIKSLQEALNTVTYELQKCPDEES